MSFALYIDKLLAAILISYLDNLPTFRWISKAALLQLRGQPAKLAKQGLQGRQVLMGIPAPQGALGKLVPPARRARKVQQGIRELRGMLEIPGLLVPGKLVPPAHKVLLEGQGRRVMLGGQERRE
jgi:hypothetical protein